MALSNCTRKILPLLCRQIWQSWSCAEQGRAGCRKVPSSRVGEHSPRSPVRHGCAAQGCKDGSHLLFLRQVGNSCSFANP